MWKCSLSSCSRWSLKSHAHFCCANYRRLIKMFEPGNMAFFLHWIWDVGSFWAKKPHALIASSEKLEENPICKRLIASVLSQRVSHWFDMGTRQHMWGSQNGCWSFVSAKCTINNLHLLRVLLNFPVAVSQIIHSDVVCKKELWCESPGRTHQNARN